MIHFKTNLIAPCGMNCGICLAYLREKNHCHGCRELDKNKKPTRWKCVIKNCKIIKNNNWKFCSDKCGEFPCKRMKSLDKRYRTKYDMSMLENLGYIKKNGIRKLVKKEEKRWRCPKCGGVICVHRKKCSSCEM
jgi:hypothetical protein